MIAERDINRKSDARILLIDDDALVVKSLKGILEKKGYHVDTAFTGEEAIEK